MITVLLPRSRSQPRCQPRSCSRNSARAPRNSRCSRNSPRSRKWSPPTRTPTPNSSALAMVGAATAIVASAASARLSFLMFSPLVAALQIKRRSRRLVPNVFNEQAFIRRREVNPVSRRFAIWTALKQLLELLGNDSLFRHGRAKARNASSRFCGNGFDESQKSLAGAPAPFPTNPAAPFPHLNKTSTKPAVYGEPFLKRRGLFLMTVASRLVSFLLRKPAGQ